MPEHASDPREVPPEEGDDVQSAQGKLDAFVSAMPGWMAKCLVKALEKYYVAGCDKRKQFAEGSDDPERWKAKKEYDAKAEEMKRKMLTVAAEIAAYTQQPVSCALVRANGGVFNASFEARDGGVSDFVEWERGVYNIARAIENEAARSAPAPSMASLPQSALDPRSDQQPAQPARAAPTSTGDQHQHNLCGLLAAMTLVDPSPRPSKLTRSSSADL